MKKILILTTIAIVASFIIGSIIFGLYNKERQEKGCLKFGGRWGEVQERNYRECRNISAGSCQMIGGKFNGCASDCPYEKTKKGFISICNNRCAQSCEFRGSAMFPFLLSDYFKEILDDIIYYYRQWKWW